MPIPRTVFDKPQASLFPDAEGYRDYANVSNRVDVSDGERRHHCAVAVPTFLFTYMREVANIPPETQVTLSLDRVEGGYVFSLLAGESLHDLWYYPRAQAPAWMLAR